MRPTRRVVLLSLAAASVSACALAFPVDLVREFPLFAPPGESSATVGIDLTEDANIWKHREEVEAYSVEAVHARILSVGPWNEAATADIDLFLRAEGAPEDGSDDVLAARVKELPLEEGTEVELRGTRGVELLLLDALKGSGRFTAVFRTRTDARVDVLLELRIAGAMRYEVVGR